MSEVQAVQPPVSPVEGTLQDANPPESSNPKAADPNAGRWAHMAKQQKALRAEQAKIKQERQAIETQRKEIETARQEIESVKSWKQRLAQKDFDVLKDAGVSQEELTQYLVNQPNPTDRQIMMLQQKIEELQGGQTNIQKSMEEQTQRQYDQAIKQISSDVKGLVAADTTRYELIHANDAHDAAVELIKQTFDTENRMMTIEEACNEVEEFLLEETSKLLTLNKIKSRMTPEPVGTKFNDVPKGKKESFTTAVRESPAPTRTLTHAQIPQASTGLSAKDRKARAIAAWHANASTVGVK